MIRALVADDSASARMSIVEILRGDGAIEVIGQARDGMEALELTKKLKPDVVTMDLEMPRLDGFEATHEIMIVAPTPIVIVSAMSHVSEAEAAVRALGVGALAVLRKPPGPTNRNYANASRELRETVKAMADVKVVRRMRQRPRPPLVERAPNAAAGRTQLIAIAASTGGPPALQAVLAALPDDFSAPILVVQHIARGFTAGLATWLGHTTRRRVKIAESAEPLNPGAVYLAPDDEHLGATTGGTVLLSSEPPIAGFRPSATFLFRSVAQAYGPNALGLILTGMGRDGVDGLHALRGTGGRVIAQDEESSIVFGMPRAAIDEGLADAIIPLDGIAARLVDAVRVERTAANGGR